MTHDRLKQFDAFLSPILDVKSGLLGSVVWGLLT